MFSLFPRTSVNKNRYAEPLGKRPYLADYRQLTDGYYLMAQSKSIVIKSILLQGMISVNKYTKHMEREIAASEANEYIEDFDEELAKKEFAQNFKVQLIRDSWNLLVKKFYEMIFVNTVDLRLADRLTKDVFKSNLRKLKRGLSSTEASSRIFFTGLYAGVIPALALFTVDCGYGMYDLYLRKEREGRKKGERLVKGVRWALRRLGLHACVALCSAGGVASGAQLNWKPQYSTLLFATLFETFGGWLYNELLGPLISAV